jgi:hypothetical protein
LQTLGKKFDSNGWHLEYDLVPKSGLVIGNVRHDDYNMARDIRVVAIWVYPVAAAPPESATATPKPELKPKVFYLATEDLPLESSGDKSYLRWTNFHAPPPFDVYNKGGYKGGPAGLQAKYKTKSKVFGDDTDPDDDFLTIEQSFIFTKYGKDPAHEPGGVLEAARVFPLIKVSYGGKKIQSIRIDYRFHISLDIFLYVRTGELDPGLDRNVLQDFSAPDKKRVTEYLKKQRPMLAAIFRDAEGLPGGGSTKNLFDSYEKPVFWEISGYGLKNGIPGDQLPETANADGVFVIADKDKSTWSNIHMWANFSLLGKYVKKQASAPGAFHAFHCHWTWPFFTQIVKVSGTAFGKEQFRGLPLKRNIGGPLLDHKIPRQTIRFAISRAKPPRKIKPANKWDADQSPSTEVFENLFYDKDNPPEPENISGGEDVVTWYSIEVEKDPGKGTNQKNFGGTVMIHGIYFAHNRELVPTASTVGEVAQKPEKHKGYVATWPRAPNDK